MGHGREGWVGLSSGPSPAGLACRLQGVVPPLVSGRCLMHMFPQLFITVMDKLRLEIRAMDEVQELGREEGPGREGRGRIG